MMVSRKKHRDTLAILFILGAKPLSQYLLLSPSQVIVSHHDDRKNEQGQYGGALDQLTNQGQKNSCVLCMPHVLIKPRGYESIFFPGLIYLFPAFEKQNQTEPTIQ